MKRILLSLFLLVSASAQAGLSKLLEPTDAFVVSAERISDRSFVVTFRVAPGYGLYKEKLAFKSYSGAMSPVAVSLVGKPITVLDELGHTQLREINRVRVDFKAPMNESMILVKIQGCADVGFCFNPEVRQVSLLKAP